MRLISFMLAASCALLLFASMATVLIGYEMKAPINESTRFTSIDWLDEQLTNSDGFFANSNIIKDFHQCIITGGFTVQRILEYGWLKVLYWFICIGLLLIFLLLVAIQLAEKSRDKHHANYLRTMWADGRNTTSASCDSYEYISFTQRGISIEESAPAGEPMVLTTSSAIVKNQTENVGNFWFPGNAL